MKLLRMVEEKVQNGWISELEHLQQYEHKYLYIRVELLTIKENLDWNLVVVSNSRKQQERERETIVTNIIHLSRGLIFFPSMKMFESEHSLRWVFEILVSEYPSGKKKQHQLLN